MQRRVTHNSLNPTPVRKMTIEYIGEDELVEITPKPIRLRKKVLEPGMRKYISISREERNA